MKNIFESLLRQQKILEEREPSELAYSIAQWCKQNYKDKPVDIEAEIKGWGEFVKDNSLSREFVQAAKVFAEENPNYPKEVRDILDGILRKGVMEKQIKEDEPQLRWEIEMTFEGKNYWITATVDWAWVDTSFSHHFGIEEGGYWGVEDVDIEKVELYDEDKDEFVDVTKEIDQDKLEKLKEKVAEEIQELV